MPAVAIPKTTVSVFLHQTWRSLDQHNSANISVSVYLDVGCSNVKAKSPELLASFFNANAGVD